MRSDTPLPPLRPIESFRGALLRQLRHAARLALRRRTARTSRLLLALAHLTAQAFEDAAQTASEALAIVREYETAREAEAGVLSIRAQALVALLAHEGVAARLTLYRAMGAEGHAARLAGTAP